MVRITRESSLGRMASDIGQIKQQLIEKVPEHFSAKHIVTAFIGAILMGLTFVLKGLVIDIANVLTKTHVLAIALSTLILLTGEIYFIGYGRVKNKAERPFGQFWLKRIATYYAIALMVSFFLVYIYAIDRLAGVNTLNVVMAVSFPCAVGASLADLLEQY